MNIHLVSLQILTLWYKTPALLIFKVTNILHMVECDLGGKNGLMLSFLNIYKSVSGKTEHTFDWGDLFLSQSTIVIWEDYRPCQPVSDQSFF